jgi:tryptophan-rich sensory protein
MKTQKSGFKFLPFIISLAITLSIGAIAGVFTVPQVTKWYLYLNKPKFNPPNWIFGPVWTLLYIMIGISAYLVWQHRSSAAEYINAKRIYFLQLFFNFSWSIVFFGLHQVLGALVIIILLLINILVNINAFSKINRTAAWLLVPYLLWVSFASVLNYAIWQLNK